MQPCGISPLLSISCAHGVSSFAHGAQFVAQFHIHCQSFHALFLYLKSPNTVAPAKAGAQFVDRGCVIAALDSRFRGNDVLIKA
jgi:hypothetical protein